MESMIRQIDADFAPLKEAFAFHADRRSALQQGQYFIPAEKFAIPADSSPGGLTGWSLRNSKRARVDEVRFTLSEQVLYKNLLTVMDLLGTNDWERPIYYSTTVSSDNYLNLDDFFMREGLALQGSSDAIPQF